MPKQRRTRVAVVSPFLDKRHGTERYLAEQIEALASKYEIHLYSSRVEDIDTSRITWHRVPSIPGPHLLSYCWWFVANHIWRWWDRRVKGLKIDLTYTPGINCLNADVISVHILFSEFQRQVKDHLRLSRNPLRSWARIIHQRFYYRLIIWLEQIVYPKKATLLTAISRRTAENLKRFDRSDVPVIYHGVRRDPFNRDVVRGLRQGARASLELPASAYCVLLIGNGWRGKGLETLLEALGSIDCTDVRLLVVGQDDPAPYRAAISRWNLSERVSFLPIRPDVECYYAAADLYACPSMEDAFGVPPLEAMACGLPVIVTSHSGVSELITDGVDGLILNDPKDAAALASCIWRLKSRPEQRALLGRNAARKVCQYTWDQNAAQLDELFEEILQKRHVSAKKRTDARIAVVSPFLDRRHGTERRASQLVERFARDYGYEVHVYSQRVEDIPRVERFRSFRASRVQNKNISEKKAGSGPVSGRVLWHKLPRLPGPHVFNYLWWFISNHLWRWWDRRFRGGKYDLVYTPGINCLDADVVSVHIVFWEFYRQVRGELALRTNPVRAWPRIVHRRLYYRLIMALEEIIYSKERTRLAVISQKTYHDVVQRWPHGPAIPVVYGGVDPSRFSDVRRLGMRPQSRNEVGLTGADFGLLMIGNDWKKKGLDCLLEAVGRLQNPSIKIIVAGQDSVGPYLKLIDRYGLAEKLIFLPIRPDVEFYYAAADAYVCPSLEDAFAYPPFEAMACGLTVIVSSQAGVSELVNDGTDGLVLKDPRDAIGLSQLIRTLYANPDLRLRLGANAAKTASQYTWERNAEQFKSLFEEVLHAKEIL